MIGRRAAKPPFIVPQRDWSRSRCAHDGRDGVLALPGNATCFALLYRHRSDDLHLRSTSLCSRNDLVANTAVLLAVGAVAATGSLWPDLVVGVGIAALFAQSAWAVLRESMTDPTRTRVAASRSLPIHPG